MPIHRINLLSGPRNISTALMYSFAQRPETQVFDEPLYAHFLKVTGVDHPGREKTLAIYENNGQKVIENILLGEHQKETVFFKNMAKHLAGLPMGFLTAFKNVILIRNPNDVLVSFDKLVAPTMQEISLDLQWELYQVLKDQGNDPVILDSDEILKDPEKVLKTLCKHLEIQFYQEMLSWKPGPRPEDGTWGEYWYDNVHQSTGFAPFRAKNQSVDRRLQPLLQECDYYYQKLFDHSLRA